MESPEERIEIGFVSENYFVAKAEAGQWPNTMEFLPFVLFLHFLMR
jgi:hypothetical protein